MSSGGGGNPLSNIDLGQMAAVVNPLGTGSADLARRVLGVERESAEGALTSLLTGDILGMMDTTQDIESAARERADMQADAQTKRQLRKQIDESAELDSVTRAELLRDLELGDLGGVSNRFSEAIQNKPGSIYRGRRFTEVYRRESGLRSQLGGSGRTGGRSLLTRGE